MQRIGKWKKQSGAALVEAGIVAPIFVMFFMLNMHLSGTYQRKIEAIQESRYLAFNYATNSCTGGGASSEASGIGNFDDGTSSGSAGAAGNPPQGELSQSIFTAHATSKKKFFYNRMFSESTVTSDSYVMCNEKTNGMNPFSYVAGVVGQLF